jgi:hypothetical protein
MRTLMMIAIKSVAVSSNPTMDQVVDCLSFVVKTESCFSYLEITCSNTFSKIANRVHPSLGQREGG